MERRLALRLLALASACCLPLLRPLQAEGQTMDLSSASVRDLLEAQAAGRLTCRQIASHVLSRIEAADSRLKVFITVNPRLLDAADALDADRRAGRVGPLHCVPAAVKDNFNTAELRTTGGSVLLAGMVPPRDSVAVARLRAAGALIVGKSNLDELAVAGSTISSIAGQTLNPYDATRFAAGSSGGSAVAVSTGMATVALGTETVNSLRNAANTAGVVAIRPTRGLVSRTGVIPLSTTMDTVGVLGRSVGDAAILLGVLVGRDPADPNTTSVEALPDADFADVRSADLRGKRLGVVRNLFGAGPEHAEVNAVIEAALSRLRSAGAETVEIGDPEFDSEASYAKLNVNNYEFKPLFERYLADLGPAAPFRTVEEYVRAGRYPVTMKGYLANAVAWKAPLESPEYLGLMRNILDFRRKSLALAARERLDAFVYPIQKRASLRLADAPRPERNGIFASALGFPAIDIPAGFTPGNARAPIGVPVGIDLMGVPFADKELIALAAAVERVLGARREPPR